MSIKTSVFLALLALCGGLAAQSTLNVPSGSYPTIQSALNAAMPGDTVMVAAGVYAEKNLDFNGKAIRLVGAGAAICAIDAGTTGRAFVFDNGETAAARVEGFAIRNGRAPVGAAGTVGTPNGGAGGHGGAVLISNASPTFVSCLFGMNQAGRGGDAFDVALGSPGATGGAGGHGGAVAVDGGSPLFDDCIFDSNAAGRGGDGKGRGFATAMGQPGHGDGGPGGHGGAVAVVNGSAMLLGCTFQNNGGGVGGTGSPSSSLGGTSGSGGVGGDGGAVALLNGSGTVADSLFLGNRAGNGGSSQAAIGGLAGSGGKGGNGGAINVAGTATAQLDDLEMSGNEAGKGGPGGDSGAFFSVIGVCGRGGDGGLGGGLASAGNANLDALLALANKAGTGGEGGIGYGIVSGPGGDGGHGGGFATLGGTNLVTNSVFSRNVSGGGGKAGAQSSNNHNSAGAAGVAGAILGALGTLDVASCTIYDNRLGPVGLGGFNYTVPGAPGVGSGLLHASGTTNMVNDIVYANLDGGGSPSNLFIVAAGLTVSYSDVGAGWPGTGNFDVDPMLVDAANDDYHLAPASPCRDVGNSAAAIVPTLDFDGQARVVCGAIDVGADEYVVLPPVLGQASRPGIAMMDINNAVNLQGCAVATGEPGPYYCLTPVGAPITFSFDGQPNQPIICVWHFLNINNVNYGPLAGQFDIGGPADLSGIPTGLTVFADGSYTYLAPYAYTLDAAGQASYSYTMPFFPSGILCAFQSAIFNTTGLKMSNAVEVTVP
ncbi:MAG: hypothetical protein H6807_17845 [Planctomycetes bacterium]|nr:hypothetical protein [Planctomycetota bacterium]